MSTTGKKGRFSVKILLRLFCLTGILFLSGCHLEKEPVAAPKEGRYLVDRKSTRLNSSHT